jgi:hypothetical protein
MSFDNPYLPKTQYGIVRSFIPPYNSYTYDARMREQINKYK